MELIIRKMKEEDLESLHRLLSDPEVMKYMEPPYTMEQTKEFLESALEEDPAVWTVGTTTRKIQWSWAGCCCRSTGARESPRP